MWEGGRLGGGLHLQQIARSEEPGPPDRARWVPVLAAALNPGCLYPCFMWIRRGCLWELPALPAQK